MFSINDIVLYSLIVIAMILGGLLLYAKYISNSIGKPVPDNVIAKARNIAFEVVYYIEQILPGETGINKKLAARDKLKRLLDEVHINISKETLDILIEAAVFLMNTEILKKVDKYAKAGDA